jgi:hypothetical protein
MGHVQLSQLCKPGEFYGFLKSSKKKEEEKVTYEQAEVPAQWDASVKARAPNTYVVSYNSGMQKMF